MSVTTETSFRTVFITVSVVFFATLKNDVGIANAEDNQCPLLARLSLDDGKRLMCRRQWSKMESQHNRKLLQYFMDREPHSSFCHTHNEMQIYDDDH